MKGLKERVSARKSWNADALKLGYFKLVLGLRGDTGGAQRETGGTTRSGGTDRIGRGFGCRWTAALRSRSARSTTRRCPGNLVDPCGHGGCSCPQPGTRPR